MAAAAAAFEAAFGLEAAAALADGLAWNSLASVLKLSEYANKKHVLHTQLHSLR